jgi:signal transduction histidine kinase/ActR/RegA family two-component response regulator
MDSVVLVGRTEPETGQTEERESTRSALDFVHGLLQGAASGPPPLADLLRALARAFGAVAAGVAAPAEGTPLVRQREGPDGVRSRWPWEERPELLEEVRHSATAVPEPRADGSSWLFASAWAPASGGLLLWLEADAGRVWSAGEAAALALAAQALARLAGTAEGRSTPWAQALERARLQERLEDAARLTGKLAHDFGNTLTGILGFTELSLSQLPAEALPHRYVKEVWQAAHQGAQWIQKLQQFSRRRAAAAPPIELPVVVGLEEARGRAAWGPDVALHVSLPEGLPPVAVEADALRQALAQLLDNAREAIAGKGVVTLSARLTELSEADCRGLLGAAGPGPHVEVTVTDTGAGLSAETRGRLFHEPFYSSKVRRRGLGLAIVYGILQTYRGAIRFGPDPAQGTAVRLFLPAAAPPAAAPPPAGRGQGPRVLVVDDDPLVLRFICTVLDGAGLRTRSAAGGAEALAAYTAPDEPFRLVLADVAMPQMNGYELVRRLRLYDPDVNVLFISSDAARPVGAPDEETVCYPLLAKPFRAEGLLQAVRAALDRGRAPVGGTGKVTS